MSCRGCNPPSTTGGEAARTNARTKSGNRGYSSRRTRCRGSGRRATKHRLNKELWAARGKTNTQNTLSHEEITSMMKARTQRGRQRVTEAEIESWVQDEAFTREHSLDMAAAQLEVRLHALSTVSVPALGNVPTDRGDGVFRACQSN